MMADDKTTDKTQTYSERGTKATSTDQNNRDLRVNF